MAIKLSDKAKLKKSMSRRLRDARINNEPHMTQSRVAELFTPPLTRAAIAQWEVGETLPDVDRLAILSKAYGVTIDVLVFGDDNKKGGEITPEAAKIARRWMALGRKNQILIADLIGVCLQSTRKE